MVNNMKTKLWIIIGISAFALALSYLQWGAGSPFQLHCMFSPCSVEVGGRPDLEDYPFGPAMNQQNCNDFVISQWQPAVEDMEMVQQFLEICIQREFLTPELVERGKRLQIISLWVISNPRKHLPKEILKKQLKF